MRAIGRLLLIVFTSLFWLPDQDALMARGIYQPIHHQRAAPKRGHEPIVWPVWGLLIVGAALGGAMFANSGWSATDVTRLLPAASCKIKGNVSINSGERIYHVPGQEYYNATVIDRRYGERWFCSEQEAKQAGWRKARR